MSDLLEMLKRRRTFYNLGKNTDVSIKDIENIIKNIIKELPSAYGIQTGRYAILFGEKNVEFWNLIQESQKVILDREMYEVMKDRFDGGKEAYGTIVFFESKEAVESINDNDSRSNLYKENNQGIALLAFWLALGELNLGGNIQYFNMENRKDFDEKIRDFLNISDDWKMLGQMYFGSIEGPAKEKESLDVDELVKVIR